MIGIARLPSWLVLEIVGYAVCEFYLHLSRAFYALGMGIPGKKVMASAPKDGGAGIVEVAKEYAAVNAVCPIAIQKLPGIVEAFTRLCTLADKPGMDAAKLRAAAAKLQADCMGYHAALKEAVAAFLERERMRTKLKKAMGTQRQRRKERRETKEDRERGRVLAVALCLGRKRMTTKQAADELGFSVRTVEGLAKKGREWGILAKRTPGPQKTVREGDTIGGRGGEREMDREAVRAYVDKQRNEEDGDGVER